MEWSAFIAGLVVMAMAGVLFRYRVRYAELSRLWLAMRQVRSRRWAAVYTPRLFAGEAAAIFVFGAVMFVGSFFPHLWA